MLTKLDYLKVEEARPRGGLELIWHEFGSPVATAMVAAGRDFREEDKNIGLALERVLRSAESINGPIWLQFEEKPPSLPAINWEGLIYRSVAKPVCRLRRWTLPSYRQSPLGSLLIVTADFVFGSETADILNELIEAAREHDNHCVVATVTPKAVQRVAEYADEASFDHFFARLTHANDLKTALSEIQSSFETLFFIADPWWSDGEPGLRIGDEKFARFLGASEIIRTAARMGAARLVLVTPSGKCAEVGRLLAHQASELAPIDVHVLVLEKSNISEAVRAYLSGLFEDIGQIEGYDPSRVLRYESPLASGELLDRYPSGRAWIEFCSGYLREFTVMSKLSKNEPWALPVQRVFEKYAAGPFESLLETQRVPHTREELSASSSGILQALRGMRSIFGDEDEPDAAQEVKPLPRFAR